MLRFYTKLAPGRKLILGNNPHYSGLPLGLSLIAFQLKMGLNSPDYSIIKIAFIFKSTR